MELEGLAAGPLVEGGVDAHAYQQQPGQPEEEVEEEHGVLDAGGDVGEPARDSPPP